MKNYQCKSNIQNLLPETIIKIADYIFAFEGVTKGKWLSFKHYRIESANFDNVFKVSKKDIKQNIKDLELKVGPYYYEYLAILRCISEWLPLHNAFLLHSACFDVEGTGVAFAAHSGTGKTTHMNLWQKLLGDKMVVVNGDKPIVRFFDDEPETPYAYGTPWNGKEHLGQNMRTKLQHICFIERSETNFVEPMKKEDVIDLMFNQVYMPKDPVAVMNTMQLIDRLLSCCKLWKIHCNMEDEAAKIAYEAIFRPNGEK